MHVYGLKQYAGELLRLKRLGLSLTQESFVTSKSVMSTEVNFHRLQASSAAEQAVLIDGNAGDGYQAADLYETAAEHLNRVIELTGENA